MTINSQFAQVKRKLAYTIFKLFKIGLPCRICGNSGRDFQIKIYPQSMLEFARCRAMSKGIYNESRFLKGFVDECLPGKTVLDIGAHIGTFTLFAAQAVGSAGKVYAFDMDRQNYQSLQLNIKRNKLDNVVAINKAVSSGSGVARYNRTSEESGDGAPSISVSSNATHRADMESIDRLIEQGQLTAPDVVKIDVEGHESEVVKGMASTLAGNSVVLFIEVHDALLKKCGESAASFDALLTSFGYQTKENLAMAGRDEQHLVYVRQDAPE